ncbi:protein of unknown function [Candidatus Nitrotoga arctica]|uniref:Uncharacterized protein n=1 Tax=Candidatus Nitrotoga arctica TaxID=453162 RepID=A0ABN8APZ4_9PROT|nr:protein of unknown function [Candidatus Nitrotoga arctica]
MARMLHYVQFKKGYAKRWEHPNALSIVVVQILTMQIRAWKNSRVAQIIITTGLGATTFLHGLVRS